MQLADRHADLLAVVDLLSPKVPGYIADWSPVPAVLADRP